MGFREGSNQSAQAQCNLPGSLRGLFQPVLLLMDATAEDEAREAAIGYTERSRLLFIVHVVRQEQTIRIISARPATTEERKIYEHE